MTTNDIVLLFGGGMVTLLMYVTTLPKSAKILPAVGFELDRQTGRQADTDRHTDRQKPL